MPILGVPDSGQKCITRGTTYAHGWQGFPDAVPAIIGRLQGVVIESRMAIAIMQTHDGPETLHYVDPPYVHSTRSKSGAYRHEMTEEDHRELASVLNELKGTVVLSDYRSGLYDELFKNWKRVEKPARADGGGKRVECLWLRNVAL